LHRLVNCDELLPDAVESSLDVSLVWVQAVVVEKIGDDEISADAKVFFALVESGADLSKFRKLVTKNRTVRN
jgi:hypothetical protein